MPEEPAKFNKKDKAKSIAYSMKLVNGVYQKLMEVFAMQLRPVEEAENDPHAKGWNDAVAVLIQMTHACKYTKDDFLDMMEEDDEESRGDI